MKNKDMNDFIRKGVKSGTEPGETNMNYFIRTGKVEEIEPGGPYDRKLIPAEINKVLKLCSTEYIPYTAAKKRIIDETATAEKKPTMNDFIRKGKGK